MIDINKISPGKKAPEIINVIIEIPKGSNNKYELDKETGMLMLDRPMYSAVFYPGDYGLVPQTHWDDGDPLDVVVLTNEPVYPLTLAEVRPVGVFQMIDSGEKDDKIIGVYASDPRMKEIKDIKDIPQHTIKEIKEFFETYKNLQEKKCEITNILGKKDALKAIEKGIKMFKEK